MAAISTISSSASKKKTKKAKIGIWTIVMVCAVAGCLMGVLVFAALHTTATTTTATTTQDAFLSAPPPQTKKEVLIAQKPTTTTTTTTTTKTSSILSQVAKAEKAKKTTTTTTTVDDADADLHPPLAGLQCAAHGGPSEPEALQEMIYWRDLPRDAEFQSPFYDSSHVRYMTFEPDAGGWNNIRMAMETVVSLAHATGRTLVMPPSQKMYLLGAQAPKKQKTHFSFADFFHLDRVGREHEGLEIVEMQEYLKREALTGRLRHKGKPVFPPQNNQTDWNGKDTTALWNYLRSVTHVAPWRPMDCVAVFPASTDERHAAQLEQWKEEILAESGPQGLFPTQEADVPNGPDFTGRPTDVNATTKERLREMMAKRKSLCIYNHEMQQHHTLHFGKGSEGSARLLIHFYAFLFFQDYRHDLWNKRFMRDHLRYVDWIQCAAARVVQAVRRHALSKTASAEFDAFHVRRGDFQYKRTRLSAKELLQRAKPLVKEGSTVYIATDERDKSFFDPLRESYEILFLDDFASEFTNLNTNYYGMLDQLVASRARVFVGTFFSTFSGFINRMRAYHAELHKEEGWRDGRLPTSFYFIPDDKQMEMVTYTGIRPPFYSREYPVSWRQIDFDVPDNQDENNAPRRGSDAVV